MELQLDLYGPTHVEAILKGIHMKNPTDRQRHFKKTLGNLTEANTAGYCNNLYLQLFQLLLHANYMHSAFCKALHVCCDFSFTSHICF